MRVDHNISAADAVFVRYTVDDGVAITPTSYPQFQADRASRGQYVTLAENHIFSTTLLNTFRASYSRYHLAQTSIDPGLSSAQFAFAPGQVAGDITIGGLSGTWGPSSATAGYNKLNIFTWSDDLFYTRGRHALKFGALINHYQQYSNFPASATPRGSISFPSVSAFLLGEASSYSAATPGAILTRTFHYNTVGFYAQDDLRVRSNFTLNLGLRYEFLTTYNETHNEYASVRNPLTDPATTIGIPFVNPSLHNFGPRVGFAWDVMGDGKTAVRGGYGLLYDMLVSLGNIADTGICAPPFCSTSSVSNPPTLTSLPLTFPASAIGNSIKQFDYHMHQPHMVEYNLAVERQLPGNIAATLAYSGSRGMNLLMYQEGNPAVPAGVPAVGANGVETCVARPAGQAIPSIPQLSMIDGSANACWLGTETRINPHFGSIEFHTAAADSWYNALQFIVDKRLSKGLQFQSSYTWSKSIDNNNPEQGGGDTTTSDEFPDDPFHFVRSPSYFDVGQVWRLNALYRMRNFADAKGVLAKFVNGWSSAGILTVQTGFPFTAEEQAQRSRSGVFGGSNPNGQSTSTDRPDLVPGRTYSSLTHGTTAGCSGIAAGQQLGTPTLWYDPCAFTLQPAGFLGDSGQNALRGPGLTNLDFSLAKDTSLRWLGEKGNMQFRADFFNIFNHTNFGTPALGAAGTAASPTNSAGIIFAGSVKDTTEPVLGTAGVITSTSTTSRQLQFSLRLIF